ncbi:MAG: hypothetical protein U5M23_05830 [Marinagarivorans sp.]|nr:hypothetical protein [Marinagarivorans sp.]
MAQMAEAGHLYPTVITALIALCLAVMGLYALSGAGVIMRLPLIQLVLVLITCVFCLRGVAGLVIPFASNNPYIAEQGVTFWLWSSGICLVIGLAYLFGVKQAWAYLAQ